jgi:Protein of unknown function (DUF2934)
MRYDALVMFKESQHMIETPEERIRKRAYHLWEASGRPSGRDEEFWQRACEIVAAHDAPPSSAKQRRQPKQAQPPRKRSRRTLSPASSGVSAPAG